MSFLEFLGPAFSLAFLYYLIGNSEFAGIFRHVPERAFGVSESRFRGKMKLICWAAGVHYCFGNEFPEILHCSSLTIFSGINFPKITLHVTVCDSRNYMGKIVWEFFSWEIACRLHK